MQLREAYLVVVAHQKAQFDGIDRLDLAHIQIVDQEVVAICPVHFVGRQQLDVGGEERDADSLAHICAAQMVLQIEIIGKERDLQNLICNPKKKTPVRLVRTGRSVKPRGIGIGRKSACPSTGASHGRPHGPVAHHLGPQVVAPLAIDPHRHIEDHRPAAAVLRRFVRYFDGQDVRGVAAYGQRTPQFLLALGDIGGVDVNIRGPEVEQSERALGVSAQDIDRIEVSELLAIVLAEGAVGIARPADARADDRDLGVLGHPVQAQAVESGPVEGQGREHGADFIAKDGPPRPPGCCVAGHHHAVEDRVVAIVALEDPAIAALLRRAVFLPPSHVKAAD